MLIAIASMLGVLSLAVFMFNQRKTSYDKDIDQHHLASMMIAAVSGVDDITISTIRSWLSERNWSKAEEQERLSHASSLAGTAVQGEVYDQVVALTRTLKGIDQ